MRLLPKGEEGMRRHGHHHLQEGQGLREELPCRSSQVTRIPAFPDRPPDPRQAQRNPLLDDLHGRVPVLRRYPPQDRHKILPDRGIRLRYFALHRQQHLQPHAATAYDEAGPAALRQGRNPEDVEGSDLGQASSRLLYLAGHLRLPGAGVQGAAIARHVMLPWLY